MANILPEKQIRLVIQCSMVVGDPQGGEILYLAIKSALITIDEKFMCTGYLMTMFEPCCGKQGEINNVKKDLKVL